MSLFAKRKPKKNWIQRVFWKFFWSMLIFTGLFFSYSEYSYHSDLDLSVVEISGVSRDTIVEISGSIPTIAQYLEDKNLIASASSFVKYVKRNNIDTKIQAGKNKISPLMTIPDIAQQLLTAYTNSITVRIPEGYTLQEVDEYLYKKYPKILTKNEFLNCVLKTCEFSEKKFSFLPAISQNSDRKKWEGYFFPATYEIDADEFSVQVLAEEMLLGFQLNAQHLGAFDDKNREISELVIMASIIEKESSTYAGNESSMISDVLWKRIDEGIPLGVDATIRYVLGIKTDALTVRDLQKDNSFNTRKNRGLPPHAISNFSAHSLEAALNPTKNQFYFYLHYNKKIHYGKTNAEHEKNKQVYCGGSCE